MSRGGLVREAHAGRTEQDMGLEVEGKPEGTGVEWARKPRKLLAGRRAGTWRQRIGAAKAGFVLGHTAVPAAQTLQAMSTYL